MRMSIPRRFVIFGATSAIAQAVARKLVAKGCSLYCVGRNPHKLQAVLDDLRVRAMDGQVVEGAQSDLSKIVEHESLFEEAEHALGGIDGVLVAHGTLPDQRVCEVSIDRMIEEFETNAMSVISLSTIAAKRFAAQGAGMIVVISSVAGDRGRQSNYVYGAAKGMVSIFLEGLRNRLWKMGVHVLTIKPGFVDTPMTEVFDKSGPLWVSPERAARDIVRAMERRRDIAYVPWFWRPIMFIIRHIPEGVFKRLSL